MASIRERTTKAGQTTWSVLYRHGQRQTSMTFATLKGDPKRGVVGAEDFQALVEALGPDRALLALNGEQAHDRLTVNELAEKFLEWKGRPGEVTERTLGEYRRDIANWIDPWFGHRAAEMVDEADVQKWVDHMATKLAPKSVADRHMLLHSIYKFGKARSRRLVSHNPCLETELPRRGKKRPKGTTVAQWRAILDVAAERNPDAHDLILFLGSVGWRWSEGAALPVGNVEQRADGSVWVDMTQVFRVIDNRQILTPDTAKSYAGFRRVPVPNTACAEMLLRRCVGKGPSDLVFTNRRGNRWSQHTFLRDTWPGLLKRAELWQGARKSPTPHWLRHMAVGVLAAAGANALQIQRYIGHESVTTTEGVYGGMIGGVGQDVLASADQILSGRGPKGMTVVGEVVAGELLSGEPADE